MNHLLAQVYRRTQTATFAENQHLDAAISWLYIPRIMNLQMDPGIKYCIGEENDLRAKIKRVLALPSVIDKPLSVGLSVLAERTPSAPQESPA